MQSFTQDPNRYQNGRNGLTVSEATDRVYPKAIATLGDGSADGGFSLAERLDLYAAVDSAIATGVSRHELYKAAGDVVVAARDGVVAAGRSLATEYAGRVRDAYGLIPLA